MAGTRPSGATRQLHELLADAGGERLRHVHTVPRREASAVALPSWCHPALAAALADAGIGHLWEHQRRAAEALHAGRHTMLSTGTASGKSLAFLLPILSDILHAADTPAAGRGPTALYLAPTKALGADQCEHVLRLALPGVRAAAYDGDTAPAERRWIREHASYVLSNPDLLHHSMLPGHAAWGSFLRRLRYVVVDESHIYRGVFGAHVANVLRRLRRVAALYRSDPTFLLASATSVDPVAHAARLTGVPEADVEGVDRDGSPRPPQTVLLWDPRAGEADSRSATAEAAGMMSALVTQGAQVLTFARSRPGVEAVALRCAALLGECSPDLAGRVAAYRGGYLPEDRRTIERAIRDGTLRGLAATNALELGVDLTGVDAVLMTGWPGSRNSLWQQAGRAGRGGEPSVAVLIAADNPLDRYLVNHPDAIFGRPVEGVVIDPGNPHLLRPHLLAAARERPLTTTDAAYFGPGLIDHAGELTRAGLLRARPGGWYVPPPEPDDRPFSLRSIGEVVRIVERDTGRVIGVEDSARAPSTVHTGAVHVHQGATHVVVELDLEAGSAVVVRGDPGWTTTARTTSSFEIGAELPGPEGALDPLLAGSSAGAVRVAFGEVTVRRRVTSFLRLGRRGEVLGEHPLDLPESQLATRGVWWILEASALARAGVAEGDVPGALHAAEHAAIALLPLVATADRGDVGGVSIAVHPQTQQPTILVYDGYAGGAGFAERGFATRRRWLAATRAAVADCRCESGCPSCVQSPSCGSGNTPLDKAGAVTVLDLLLGA